MRLNDPNVEKGNTSVDSAMGDTPSNYNIPNQWFENPKIKMHPNNKYNEEDEDMYEDDSNGELEEVLTDNS